MSLFKLEVPFSSLRGKICRHSKIIFAKRGETQYTSQICHPRTKAFSAAELERQTKFASAIAHANTAMADATQLAEYQTAFAKQKRYKTLRGYVIAQEYAKL